MYKIIANGRLLEASFGENLLQVLRRGGVFVDAPCGGHGTCGKCKVLLDGAEASACRVTVERDMTVETVEEKTAVLEGDALAVQADGQHEYVLACDLGTTTIVCYLLSGITGQVLGKRSCLNPQSAYGADVISRIQYAMEHGAQELQFAAEQAIRKLAAELCGEKKISMTCIVGNTAMHHLLLGFDPKPLTVPPYMPSVRQAVERDGLRVLPNIAGFVGADTVGCLLSTEFDKRQELTLLIDIGTNGEMVLGNKDGRLACSTAAGPAFEGAKISCGMRGAEGAVDHVWIQEGLLHWSVIGGGKAIGLCGSGLLDLTACLLRLGVITPSGRMACGQYRLGDTDVVLTQKDVREVQLAKAAIRAGIELMCEHRGILVQDVEQVLLAGAFGNYMDPEAACAIGMIPPQLLEKISPVGNAAGTGAAMCAADGAAFDRAKTLAERTQFLELASMAQFQDLFVDCLSFGEDDDD